MSRSNIDNRGGIAYALNGRPIDVFADKAGRTVEIVFGETLIILNLSNVEQLQNALNRAMVCLALDTR